MEKELTYNTVIVGAGVSGLYAALKLPKEQNILLICKEDLRFHACTGRHLRPEG